MSETFKEIPGSWNVPGSYTEVRFIPPTAVWAMPARMLVIALQKGLLTSSALYQNVASDQLRQIMGIGSSGSIAVRGIETVCPGMPMDVLAVQPGTGAKAASIAVTFSGTAATSGTMAMYVGGQRITFGVSSGDTATTVAANFAATYTTAHQALTGLNVPTVSGAAVTFAPVEASQFGADIDVRVSPYAADAVAGITATVVTSAGAGAPSIAAALATVAATWYTGIVTTLYDVANLQTLASEAKRRYGAMVRKDARVYAAIRGTYASLLQVTSQLNSPYVQILGASNPMWPLALAAGAFGGACELSLNGDPALQMRGVELTPLAGMAPQGPDLFIDGQRNVLLGSGISTFDVGTDGTVELERVVATYQTDSAGVPLSRPMDIMTAAIASRVRYDWNSYVRATWPRAKLADDSSPLRDAANVVTPVTLAGAWAGRCKLYEANGWIEDVDTLAPEAVFSLDNTDKNRMNDYLPIKPVGAFIIDANLLEVQE